MLEAYPNDVRVVIKHFPLRSHRFAARAAFAVLAAGKQGKYWEMSDRLFDNSSSLSEEVMLGIVSELKLDKDKFLKDIEDPEIIGAVQADYEEGIEIGVRGTPSVYVNGRPIEARSFEAMKSAIDEELKKVETK